MVDVEVNRSRGVVEEVVVVVEEEEVVEGEEAALRKLFEEEVEEVLLGACTIAEDCDDWLSARSPRRLSLETVVEVEVVVVRFAVGGAAARLDFSVDSGPEVVKLEELLADLEEEDDFEW